MSANHQNSGTLAIIDARLRRNVPTDHQATALLIQDGIITAIGSDDKIRAAAPAGTEIIAANGATVTPGLFDSHAHPDSGAISTRGADLGGIGTIAALRDRLADEARRLTAGAWLEGWNLEYEMFEETGIDRDTFEDVVDGHPTFLRFYDGHTGLVSLSALTAAGVDRPIRYPDGSHTVTDPSGRFTGELSEMTTLSFMTDAIPVTDTEAEMGRLETVLLNFAATGLTGCAIMDGSARTPDLLRQLEERGRLPQRVVVHAWHQAHFTDDDQERIIQASHDHGRLWQAGAVKLFSDGVIDTGTALLHEPDSHGDGRRAAWPDWPQYERVIRKYHDAGLLIATHAVGDRAVSDVLDAYAELPLRDSQLPAHSIEHLEVMSDADVIKLGRSGITASMQPLHMQWRQADFSDNWAQRLGPDRRSTGYRCRSSLDAGVRVVLGSDWPVAQYDPRIGMAWARGRHKPGADPATAFEPDEQVTGEEALLAYTLWPALARGWPNRGHLSAGALGDVTVFAQDPATTPADELPDLPVLLTIVDGNIVYRDAAI